jgi:8-oxo-dGTP diphosphatase
VLVVQRGQAPMAGRWSLPGGRLESGESLREAVRREVLEETKVRVGVGELVDVVEILAEGFHYVVLDYLCWPLDPSVKPSAGDDARGARYVSPSDLETLGATEAVIGIVKKALQMCSEARAGGTR